MSTIRKLVEAVVLPTCEAELSVETQRQHIAWANNGFEDRGSICTNRAKYWIEGKNFCKKHAGLYLLDNLDRITLTAKD